MPTKYWDASSLRETMMMQWIFTAVMAYEDNTSRAERAMKA
jgi:hypothetical protein